MIRAPNRPVLPRQHHRNIGFLRSLSSKLRKEGPPSPPKIATALQVGKFSLQDDYAWMQPPPGTVRAPVEVAKHIAAENDWTDRFATKRFSVAKTLLREMVGRGATMPAQSTEEMLDGYLYFTKNVDGKEWPLYCRRRPGGEEEVLLDQNEEAKGHRFFAIGTLKVSPNSRFLAYTRSTTPDSTFECILKDLKTGKTVGRVPAVLSIEWSADSMVVFYTVADKLQRPSSVRRYRIGGIQARDVTVLDEADPRFFLDVKLSKDRQYVIITSASKDSTEVWVLDATSPLTRPHRVAERQAKVEYFVNHANDRFYMVSNWESTYYRISYTDRVERKLEDWRVLYRPVTGISIEDVDFFKSHTAVWETEDAEMQCRLFDLSGRELRVISPPIEAAHVEPGINSEYNTTTLRYTYSSLTQPEVTVDHDMATGLEKIVREVKLVGVNGNLIFDPSKFVTSRVWTTPGDDPAEVSVPVTLAHAKDAKLDGSRPLLLHGYGAYGEATNVAFRHERLTLLERGWTYASAHVRGGGELGREWYDGGRKLAKKNSFLDFIRVTEELVTNGYTRPDRTFASASSAGGLLLGAVANMRPELYRGMVLKVPFVDVTTAMLDASLPLTQHEFDEWGDPSEPEALKYLLSYDPYRNVRPQAYPEMLITGALLDGRVPYWQPLKYAAKLRAMRTDDRETLLRIYMDGGHSGEGGRLKQYEEVVLEYVFLLSCFAAQNRPVTEAGAMVA